MLISQAIEISVNGNRFEVPGNCNITSLLAFLKIPADRVAVEMNKILVRKRDWVTTEVPVGASIEIVEFVGGG